MRNENRTAFACDLALCAEVFAESLSDTRIEAYFVALADLDLDTVRHAIRHLIGTARYFPRPAEIREAIEGSPGEQALAAWTRVEAAAQAIGGYASVDFGDPVLHATVAQLGGWPEVAAWGSLDFRGYGFKRAEFLATYGLFRRRGTIGPARLAGIAEVTNALTRGQWVRGLGHEDEVVALGPTGREVIGRRTLEPAVPQRALPAGQIPVAPREFTG